jgi:hypothetical protein
VRKFLSHDPFRRVIPNVKITLALHASFFRFEYEPFDLIGLGFNPFFDILNRGFTACLLFLINFAKFRPGIFAVKDRFHPRESDALRSASHSKTGQGGHSCERKKRKDFLGMLELC